MTRFLSAMKMDVILQVRSQLYTIGIVAAIIVAVAVSQLGNDAFMPKLAPTLILAVIGGSTLLYVSGMIIFERDEGTLNALIVSPLRTNEYLWSKVLSLTLLATFETTIMIGGAMLIMTRAEAVTIPNVFVLAIGVIVAAMLCVLLGIVMIVRYTKITDYLLPMAGIATILQIPMLYFLGMVESPLMLLIPSSAPIMLVQAAYTQLTLFEWVYAIGYTAFLFIGLTIWAQRAFHTHVIMKVG